MFAAVYSCVRQENTTAHNLFFYIYSYVFIVDKLKLALMNGWVV